MFKRSLSGRPIVRYVVEPIITTLALLVSSTKRCLSALLVQAVEIWDAAEACCDSGLRAMKPSALTAAIMKDLSIGIAIIFFLKTKIFLKANYLTTFNQICFLVFFFLNTIDDISLMIFTLTRFYWFT